MKPLLLFVLPVAGSLAGWFLRPVLRPAASQGAVAEGGLVLQEDSEGRPGSSVKAGAQAPAAAKAEVLPVINPADPKAAIKSLLTFSRAAKSPMRMQARLLEFADRLNPADLKALSLEVCQQPGNYWGSGGDALKEVLLSRWTEVSPAEALAFVKGANTAQTREALRYVFGQLASQDAGAAEAAETAPTSIMQPP